MGENYALLKPRTSICIVYMYENSDAALACGPGFTNIHLETCVEQYETERSSILTMGPGPSSLRIITLWHLLLGVLYVFISHVPLSSTSRESEAVSLAVLEV